MSAAFREGLALADELIGAGIPVIRCAPHEHYSGCRPGCSRELSIPNGWPTAPADPAALLGFRPGVDTLALVTGHGVDVLDIDSKAGATLADLPRVEHFGITRTPSGGWHALVPSTGLAKGLLRAADGRVIGDYLGGARNGSGRALAFLPGSHRPKYPDALYTPDPRAPWDITRALEAEPDPLLLGWLTGVCGLTAHGDPARPAADSAEVRAWLAAHADAPGCAYGRASLARILAAAPSAPGGRHHWAVGSAARVVELIGAGCLPASALEDLRERFARVKPEGATDWPGMVAWALGNADPAPRCEHTTAAGPAGLWKPTLGGVARHPSPLPGADPAPGDGTEAPGTYYADLSWLLAGEPPPRPQPVWVRRSDGLGLFYPGRVNGLFGDPETGKTWVAHVAVVEALAAGERVAIIDADHNTAEATATRLLALGVDPAALADPDRFRYIDPEDANGLLVAVADLVRWAPAVVVLDSLGELLPLMGAESNSNDDVTSVLRALTVPLLAAGACIIAIDHQTKSPINRGGYAIGAGAKKRAVRGSYLRAEKVAEIVPGQVGRIRLHIEKDSGGTLRAASLGGKVAGLFTLNATDPAALVWDLDAGGPPAAAGVPGVAGVAGVAFRPTHLMQRVSEWLEEHPGSHARTEVTESVQGRKSALAAAIDTLEREGYVTLTEYDTGHQRQRRYAHARAYREDPADTGPGPVRNPPDWARSTPPEGGTGPAGPGPVSEAPEGTPVPPVPHRSHTGPTPVPGPGLDPGGTPVPPVPPPYRGTGDRGPV